MQMECNNDEICLVIDFIEKETFVYDPWEMAVASTMFSAILNSCKKLWWKIRTCVKFFVQVSCMRQLVQVSGTSLLSMCRWHKCLSLLAASTCVLVSNITSFIWRRWRSCRRHDVEVDGHTTALCSHHWKRSWCLVGGLNKWSSLLLCGLCDLILLIHFLAICCRLYFHLV